jgi:hypothetical protein
VQRPVLDLRLTIEVGCCQRGILEPAAMPEIILRYAMELIALLARRENCRNARCVIESRVSRAFTIGLKLSNLRRDSDKQNPETFLGISLVIGIASIEARLY